MISTRWRPDTRRLLIAGLVLSVLLHLFGGWLWSRLRQTPIMITLGGEIEAKHKEADVAQPEPIMLEKAPPKVSAKVAPPPRAHFAELKPIAHALAPRPVVHPPTEMVHLVAHARNAQPVARSGGLPQNVPQPHAQTAERPSPHRDRSPVSSLDIDRLNSQFAETIKSTHQDLSATVAQVQEPVGARHLIAEGLTPGQGYMRSIDYQRIDRTHVRHYVHYTYMYPDGHVEEDDIPWPFFFTIRDDPFFDRRQPAMHMQLPPPSFRPTRPLTPIEQEAYNAAQAQPPPAPSP